MLVPLFFMGRLHGNRIISDCSYITVFWPADQILFLVWCNAVADRRHIWMDRQEKGTQNCHCGAGVLKPLSDPKCSDCICCVVYAGIILL